MHAESPVVRVEHVDPIDGQIRAGDLFCMGLSPFSLLLLLPLSFELFALLFLLLSASALGVLRELETVHLPSQLRQQFRLFVGKKIGIPEPRNQRVNPLFCLSYEFFIHAFLLFRLPIIVSKRWYRSRRMNLNIASAEYDMIPDQYCRSKSRALSRRAA